MLALCLLVTGVFYGTQRMETAAVNGISQAVYQRELKEAEKNQPDQSAIPGQPPEDEDQDCPNDPEIPDGEPSTPEQLPEPPKEVTISRDIKTSANGVRSSIWRE